MRERRAGSPAAGTPARLEIDDGASFADLIVALGLVVILGALSVPVTARAVEAGRARHAAGFVAATMRDVRQRAAFQGRSAGIVFDQTPRGWVFRVCTDGNGNGLSRSEADEGTDPCPDGLVLLDERFRDVSIAVDPALRGPGGEAGSPDPVRFGPSDLASFSPYGNATSGTLFLRSVAGTQYCVRIGGIGGRTRVLRYDPGSRVWRP